MMPSTKYSRIPLSDNEEEGRMSAFDFSSPFSYENAESSQLKYKSAFTYSSTSVQIENDSDEITAPKLAIDNFARLLVMVSFFVIYIVTFPVMVWFSFKKIQVHERFVIFRLGRLHKCKGPGLVFILPLLDRCHKIDVRLKAFSVPPKQIITGDGAIIEVGAEIYFQIIDAKKSVTNVQDLNMSTRILLQTCLCNILSKKSLSEIQSERRLIAETMMKKSNETCIGWGVEIQKSELSQIKVLNEAPPKGAPTLMMPPGLMGAGSGGQGLSSVLMHLASAVMTKGPEQTEAISEAFKAFTAGSMPPVEQPSSDVTSAGNGDFDKVAGTKGVALDTGLSPCYTRDEIITAIQNALSEDLVRRVGAVFQFEISGPEGGIFHLDLLNGLVFILPLLDRCHKIDVRLKAFSVPPKQIITGDGAIIEVGAEIYFQIIDAKKSVTNVQDLNMSTRILLQTCLCNILSKKSLSEIQSERRLIAETMMKKSNETCIGWGVEIQKSELSQIKVLNEAPPKGAPTLMMPPGLMGAGSGGQGLSSVLMHLASAVMTKGPEQTEAISEAFKAFTAGSMPPVEQPSSDVTSAGNGDFDKVAGTKGVALDTGLSPCYTRDEIITAIQNALSEDLVRRVGAVFQFEISGPEGGIFHLDLLNGSGSIGSGPSPTGEFDAALAMSMDDLQAMLQGQLAPFHAYMSGRLKVTGETRTAMRLEELVEDMKTPNSGGLTVV